MDSGANQHDRPDLGNESDFEEYLRGIWREAIKDKSPGVNPDEVFERLKRKYGMDRAESA